MEQVIAKPELFSKREAANILNCSEITIHRQIKSNKLGHFRIGKKVLISREHINRFLQRCERMPSEAA
jgi:excisionase family DNA binding protein